MFGPAFAQPRPSPRSVDVDGVAQAGPGRGGRHGLLLAPGKRLVAYFQSLDEAFALGERGGRQFAAAPDHPLTQRYDALGKLAFVPEQVHEQARVLENPAHCQADRWRST